LWGTLAFASFCAMLVGSQVLLTRWAASNVAFSSSGIFLGVATILLAPVGIAVVTVGLIMVLRSHLGHGAVGRSSASVIVRGDRWDDARLGVLRWGADSMQLRVEGEDAELTVPLATIESTRLDGEYLEIVVREGDAPRWTIRVSPQGEEFADRANKVEWTTAMRSRLGTPR
jgi:hypothetical protein